MPTITFKAKVEEPRYLDGTSAGRRIKVPALSTRHCDMSAFRKHARFGAYANSDLFPSVLSKAMRDMGVTSVIRLDNIPAGVTVDESGFLARVTVEVP